jgi:transposase
MSDYTLKQAASMLRIDAATLYRWMKDAEIAAFKKTREAGGDERSMYITDEQVKQLRALHKRTTPRKPKQPPDTTQKALQAIQQEMAILHDTMNEMRAQLNALLLQENSNVPQPPTTRPTRATATPERISEEGSTLPDGYVAFYPFVESLHHMSPSTAKRKLKDVIIRGKWNDGGHEVTLALDTAGQHAFHEAFAGHEKFTACPECPHDTNTVQN